ncbi:MAG: hypothetical protein HZB98_13225, partial [Bacteroidia bacterium]|nr:hypothetical protein [Bacteroidia bacterium]
MSRLNIPVVFILLLTYSSLRAQNEFDVVKNNWLQYSDIQNSLYHHLANQAIDLLAKRSGEIGN